MYVNCTVNWENFDGNKFSRLAEIYHKNKYAVKFIRLVLLLCTFIFDAINAYDDLFANRKWIC